MNSMQSNSYCQRCRSEISEQRLQETPVSCQSCGWSQSTNNSQQKSELQSKTIATFVLASVLMLSAHFFTTVWGKYSFSVIPLLAKSTLSISSEANLLELSEMAIDRRLLNKAEDSLLKALDISSDAQSIRLKLADLSERRRLNDKALEHFGAYFSNQGTDLDSAHRYAKLLAKKGFNEEADRYFNYVLDSKPGTFQITVSKDYVSFLMTTQQFRKAKKFIENVRRRGTNAANFMELELQKIKDSSSLAVR